VAEQLGEHPVGHDRGEPTLVSGTQALGQLEGLDDRHLLGCGHDHHTRGAGIVEDLLHPSGLLADHTDLHELVDRLGGAELGDDVTAGAGIDHHEVVVVLADLPRHLAHGEDLADARRGVGDEVEAPRQRSDAGDERQPDVQPEVLPQRLLGGEGHHVEAGLHLAGFEAGGAGLEEAGEVALGVDLADEGAPPARGGERRDGRADGGLADPALAGDEQQSPLQEVERHGRLCYPPNPMRRESEGLPIST
jgi:hypothetical protein